jgi:hypothetical protein
MSEAATALRKTTLQYCSRLRALIEKVCVHGVDEKINEMDAVVKGMLEDLGPYEESFEEELIPQVYGYSARTKATSQELYASFWAAIENYDLYGTSDLTEVVLELEDRDTKARAQPS